MNLEFILACKGSFHFFKITNLIFLMKKHFLFNYSHSCILSDIELSGLNWLTSMSLPGVGNIFDILALMYTFGNRNVWPNWLTVVSLLGVGNQCIRSLNIFMIKTLLKGPLVLYCYISKHVWSNQCCISKHWNFKPYIFSYSKCKYSYIFDGYFTIITIF